MTLVTVSFIMDERMAFTYSKTIVFKTDEVSNGIETTNIFTHCTPRQLFISKF